eukprot:g9394.t1
MAKTAVSELSEHQIVLEKMTSERNHSLDRWADAKALGLTPEEEALVAHQRAHLKFLFGETGFNPPVPARNPISVALHNPRFGAALWAVNTEAYRRKGSLSRSQKEVIALGISLANQCPHCAYIHTAMGPAAGDDVTITDMQRFYQTMDPFTFPEGQGQNTMNHQFAAWAISHRDGEPKPIPCTAEQVPEVLGTCMLFSMLNRIVDAFVSKEEEGPMFPLPVRLMMRVRSVAPMVQRMMAWMMSWMMHGEDKKVTAGKSLVDINKVAPIVKGFEGCADELPLPLPEALSWAAAGSGTVIPTALSFLAAEAEMMAECFVSPALKTYMETWVSKWDGAKTTPSKAWLESEVTASGFGEKDKVDVVMLRLMLVMVVASPSVDETMLSECQAMLGFRGTHATVLWAAFLAAQRLCQRAYSAGLAPTPPPGSD